MKKYFILILISVVFLSCNKNEEYSCIGDTCLGSHNLTLTEYTKKAIIIKDTVYKFGSVNDTLSLQYKSTLPTFYLRSAECECSEKGTDIKGELLYGTYLFLGKNLAVQYVGAADYPDKSVFDVQFVDTNIALHSYVNGNYNIFRQSNFDTKIKNMDSLVVNGKTYYDIYNSYDLIYNPAKTVTNCIYSKNYGIIKFTLDSVQYTLVP